MGCLSKNNLYFLHCNIYIAVIMTQVCLVGLVIKKYLINENSMYLNMFWYEINDIAAVIRPNLRNYQSSPSVGPSVRAVSLDRSPDCSPVQSVHEPRTGLDRHVIGLDWTGLDWGRSVQSSPVGPVQDCEHCCDLRQEIFIQFHCLLTIIIGGFPISWIGFWRWVTNVQVGDFPFGSFSIAVGGGS